ncbi:hypothetical protein KMT30_49575, partial [Streptomyces sp. IBSBF 2953]|nr:hypothetical protein [Streptomyces hayashii]
PAPLALPGRDAGAGDAALAGADVAAREGVTGGGASAVASTGEGCPSTEGDTVAPTDPTDPADPVGEGEGSPDAPTTPPGADRVPPR